MFIAAPIHHGSWSAPMGMMDIRTITASGVACGEEVNYSQDFPKKSRYDRRRVIEGDWSRLPSLSSLAQVVGKGRDNVERVRQQASDGDAVSAVAVVEQMARVVQQASVLSMSPTNSETSTRATSPRHSTGSDSCEFTDYQPESPATTTSQSTTTGPQLKKKMTSRAHKAFRTRHCKFYSRGVCKMGTSCAFLHTDGEAQKATETQSAPLERYSLVLPNRASERALIETNECGDFFLTVKNGFYTVEPACEDTMRQRSRSQPPCGHRQGTVMA
mmetsp:Transcript_25523/g.58939  ORF Transcript_25523/g.58939 Transcript_25523/m.58939 type:complete len:273 (-) Transcript_25523:131-949(-)